MHFFIIELESSPFRIRLRPEELNHLKALISIGAPSFSGTDIHGAYVWFPISQVVMIYEVTAEILKSEMETNAWMDEIYDSGESKPSWS